MGKTSEGPPEVSFVDENSCTVRKKVAYVLGFLAVASCIVVGLVVYYAGVMGLETQCLLPGSQSSTGGDNSKPDTGVDKPKKPKVRDVRLPRHLKPELYKLELLPFIIPDNFTIRGHLELTLECVAVSKNVTLHVADMTLNNDTITLTDMKNGKKIPIEKHAYDKDREFYIAHLSQQLTPGNKYKIVIDYVANLNDDLKGFYRSVYKDLTTGEEEYIAVTQFQPTDARRAFPCLDEPAIKAKFAVTLGRTKDMTSISNMPIKNEGVPMSDNDEYVWDVYEESVPMPTYLVAFVVSKFGFEVSPSTDNNVMFRIWARKDALDQIAYAKEVGPKMLEYFEEYFNVTYPLPKQDMIAIPDFSAGAMENWGLITYRETALLFKPGVSALGNKQRIAIVISHELAHQWFGNLVTPSWWTDLWLNEGFASYVEYLGVEAVQPELKLLEQFVYLDLQSVFRIDALETSHPISIPVGHPDEINEIFDRISYAKGASIIRMMDKFLSTGTFQKGLTNYLNAFKFAAAEQDDLWHYLTEQAHRDNTLPEDLTVKIIMDTWTLQMGFPVVTVERDYGNSNKATIHQDRFLISKSKDNPDKHNYMWWIPITFTSPGGDFSNTKNDMWMSNTEKSKEIVNMPDDSTPVIFNIQETGYYRVNYDEKNWKMIIKQLNEDHMKIHVINRAQIIDDAINLARSGLLSYEIALGVTSYLNKEVEYIPWAAALSGMGYISQMLKRTSAYGAYKKYMKKLVDPLYNRVGYKSDPNDQPLDVFLRKLAVNWACSLGNEDCIEKAEEDFKVWMDKRLPDAEEGNPIDVDMKSTVYCQAIRNGDEQEWDFAWERYKASNVATEKRSLLGGLSCTKEIWLLNKFLNMSLTEGSGIRKADGRSVISRIAINLVGRDLAFDFIRDKWDRVVDYYGSLSFAMAGLMKNVLSQRNTEFSLNEIETFYEKNSDTLSSAEREVKQAIEGTRGNIKWMENNYEIIYAWLQKQK